MISPHLEQSASSINVRRLHCPSLAAAVALILTATAIPALGAGRRPVRLRLYMHYITGGPGQTAVQVVNGTGPPHPSMPPGSHFGDTLVVDDLLMEGPAIDSKPVARAQGSYTLASLVDPVVVVSITDGPYKGSTIVIAGRDDVLAEVRELAVVGGTGQLRRASGHVVWTTARVASPVHWVLQLDVYASVPSAAAAASASVRNDDVTADAGESLDS